MKGLGLKGVIAPLVTPFDEHGNVNTTALQQLVDHLIGCGVHGFLVGGTTGEGPLLSTAERQLTVQVVVERTRGRVPVLAQVGTPGTAETIQLAKHARDCGANAVSVLCPYFFALDQHALIEHFCAVAYGVPDVPVYLYNIPQRTANVITAQVTSAVVARCPNVVGEKDSSGDLNLVASKLHIADGRLEILLGSDALVLPALVMGAHGAIAGNANVIPELFVQLFESYWRGDLAEAQAHQRQIRDFIGVVNGNLALFKALVAHKGIAVGDVRQPLPSVDPDMVARCVDQLRALRIDLR